MTKTGRSNGKLKQSFWFDMYLVRSVATHLLNILPCRSTWECTTSRSPTSATIPAVKWPSAKSATSSAMREYIPVKNHFSANIAPSSLPADRIYNSIFRYTKSRRSEPVLNACMMNVANCFCIRAAWESIIKSAMQTYIIKLKALKMYSYSKRKKKQLKKWIWICNSSPPKTLLYQNY